MSWVLLLLIQIFSAPPITKGLEGKWTGTITQNKGGFKAEYHIDLFLVQKGSTITGKSYVKSDDIYAYFEIIGSINKENIITFKDVKILKEKHYDNMEWCFKSAQLKYINQKGVQRLEGDWSGKTSTSDCIPGKIYLQRARERA